MFNPEVRDWQQWLTMLVPTTVESLFDRDREGNPTGALTWLDALACARVDWHPAIAEGLRCLGRVGTPLADTAVVEFFRRSWSARLFGDAAREVAADRPDLTSDPSLNHGVALRLTDLLPLVASGEAAAARELPRRDLELTNPVLLARALKGDPYPLAVIGFPHSALPLSPLAVGCLLDASVRPLAVGAVDTLLSDPLTAPDALEFGLYAPIKPSLLPAWSALQVQQPAWLGDIRGLLTGPRLLQRCMDLALAEIATPPPPLPARVHVRVARDH